MAVKSTMTEQEIKEWRQRIAEKTRQERAEQGLPEKVEDPTALRKIAQLLSGWGSPKTEANIQEGSIMAVATGNGRNNGFKPSERTLTIVDIVLNGGSLSLDDIVEAGLAKNRLEAAQARQDARRYLRKHFPEVPTGTVPGHNGGLGRLKIVKTLEEGIAVDRRAIDKARGYVGGARNTQYSVSQGRSAEENAAIAAGCGSSITQFAACFVTMMTQFVIGSGDSQLAKQLGKSIQKQLEAAK
jgi:hypothetical protein